MGVLIRAIYKNQWIDWDPKCLEDGRLCLPCGSVHTTTGQAWGRTVVSKLEIVHGANFQRCSKQHLPFHLCRTQLQPPGDFMVIRFWAQHASEAFRAGAACHEDPGGCSQGLHVPPRRAGDTIHSGEWWGGGAHSAHALEPFEVEWKEESLFYFRGKHQYDCILLLLI